MTLVCEGSAVPLGQPPTQFLATRISDRKFEHIPAIIAILIIRKRRQRGRHGVARLEWTLLKVGNTYRGVKLGKEIHTVNAERKRLRFTKEFKVENELPRGRRLLTSTASTIPSPTLNRIGSPPGATLVVVRGDRWNF